MDHARVTQKKQQEPQKSAANLEKCTIATTETTTSVLTSTFSRDGAIGFAGNRKELLIGCMTRLPLDSLNQ